MMENRTLIAEARTRATSLEFNIRHLVLEMAKRLESAIENDVVPVVRCKDCKYEEECIHRIKFLSINKKPELCTAEYHPLDFCSYGERREGE